MTPMPMPMPNDEGLVDRHAIDDPPDKDNGKSTLSSKRFRLAETNSELNSTPCPKWTNRLMDKK
jgi:hypothetical protein